MRLLKLNFILILCCLLWQTCTTPKTTGTSAGRAIWTKEQANRWYARQPWLVGANFVPSTAINQLEMWQAETFDTATINRELGWANSLGMNTMRVFLHDLAYQQDSIGFLRRIDIYLNIADRHDIKTLIVFFDSVWDPNPKSGKQRDPKPHTHNSGWIQSPGKEALSDSTEYPRLERYVKSVVTRFRNDDRILGWDVWNEPDNTNDGPYGKVELQNKVNYVLPLLQKTFVWVRSANPSQPTTCAIWRGDWSTHEGLSPIEKIQIEESDIISFHNYDNAAEFEKRVNWLLRYNRPILCTEYMARGNGSTFEGSLPIGKKYNIAMYNWGFVNGKSQTIYPWNSWEKTYTAEPEVWFHDIFRADGTPYRQEEVNLIRQLTGKK
ncbi:MAG: 1,4-beta-xylanase [Saprospiraceae bacterium]